MDDLMLRFIHWEGASRDTIDFKRCYCEISDDLVSGILLSQIIFWHLPDRKGETKLRVFKDGRYWLAKARGEWKDECFISANQFDRASKILVKKGFILKKTYKFDAAPTAHVSIEVENIMKALAKNMEGKKETFKKSLGLRLLAGSTPKEPKKPKVKKDYFGKLSGLKLGLFNSAKAYFELNGKKIGVDVTSDKKLKEYIFEHFWNVYDKKYLKQDSLIKFRALSFIEIKKAIDVTPKYKENAGKYQFKPSKYLSNKVFEDDMAGYKYNQNQKKKREVNEGEEHDDYWGNSGKR